MTVGGIDSRTLRNAFGAFATGVTIVTTRQPDGTPRGFTANSFTSVSLDPPLLLVCLAKTAHSCESFMQAAHFAVNVLAEDQKAVSGLFASQVADKFGQCSWKAGAADVPLVDGSLAQFACEREQLVDAGDHVVLIGRVIEASVRDGNPLGYFRGNYFSIGLEDRLVSAFVAKGATRIGAVLTMDNRILLEEQAGGALSVPVAPEAEPSLDGLRAMMLSRGMKPEVDFLYAVYENRETGVHGIFYHGLVSGEAPTGMVLQPLDTLPLDRVADAAERSMLRRYAEEFRHGTFGIYQGNEATGQVRRISR
ncbi:FMN reductase (NADH) NtaB [Defluviimonas aquaemixtae]|uniref:FMN reductase (NADH) NtaB n=1 Tax=Albidovulum aquaemixtae TaxID=1542388 RepID=A0A2R8BLH1_9RHOB|nr:flavin reductase family protein [Defluviimonas aquaemixtae]SPH24246.1 FMN reductase (NADH) NtaB [Defluviimonas aquaemixtae]